MLTFSNELKILVSTKPVDMRKAIDGLNQLVMEHLQLNPQEKYLFLFCNQQRNKIKGIYWHKNGFVMIYKRLERKKFYIPKQWKDNRLEITHQQLSWLLAGFDFMNLIDHPELQFTHYS